MGFVFSKIINSLLGQKEMRIKSQDQITLERRLFYFQVRDLGGQNPIRLYWRSYYPNTNGIIYVIDSFDQGRLKTSKEELMTLLYEEELKNVPLLILANKQDMQGALTEIEICEFLKLEEEKSRNWTIQIYNKQIQSQMQCLNRYRFKRRYGMDGQCYEKMIRFVVQYILNQRKIIINIITLNSNCQRKRIRSLKNKFLNIKVNICIILKQYLYIINMLSQKKEQFRQQIRKQRLEAFLMESRKKIMLKNDAQSYQDQMDDEIVELCNQVEADQHFNILKNHLLKTILEKELTNSIVLLIQLIVKKCKEAKQIDDLETLFEEHHLGQRILDKCEKEQNLVYLDEQLYLLGQLSQSSLLCQATLIQLQIVQCLDKLIDLGIDSDDVLLSTFMYLITTFVEPNSRIPYQDIKQIMSIVDKLCKKLRGINYLDIELDLENNEKYSDSKHSLLSRMLLFARYFIDKSQFSINLTLYQNFWIILTTLAFIVQEQYSLRQTALQVISESIKLNDSQIKFDIIEKHPDIFYQLLMIIDHHQQTNKITDKCIRTQASVIMKQLFCDQSQYIIQNIHLNQIPIQFLVLVEREKDRQVLYHQIEALFLLCANSSFEQCIDLYNNGLLTLLISTYQEMKEWQDYILCKQLIKLTFSIIQHNSNDNRILNYLKQNNITYYLNDIVTYCKNEITCQRANQLLKYIQ